MNSRFTPNPRALDELRFSEDIPQKLKRKLPDQTKVIAEHAFKGLEVSASLTPLLDGAVSDVCDVFSISRSRISVFVENTSSCSAYCINTADDTCVILMSSGLVNLLAPTELKFVIGHELGHYALGHFGTQERNAKDLQASRAAELSCDRFGFYGAGSLESSLKAIMKTASGLDDTHLRFDMSAFSNTAKSLENANWITEKSTHPALVVRFRALLRLDSAIKESNTASLPGLLESVDKGILNDLQRYVDGGYRAEIKDLKRQLLMWKVAHIAFHAGEFGPTLRRSIENALGAEDVKTITKFITDDDVVGVAEDLDFRVRSLEEQIHVEYAPNGQSEIDEVFKEAYSLAQENPDN